MDCLIQIYNEDKISNLLSTLVFAPKKVVLLYSGNFEQLKEIELLARSCIKELPKIKFEYKFFRNTNVEEIENIFSLIIHKNPNCCLNITGASELGAIGAYLAGVKNFIPIFKININKNKFLNIKGFNSLDNKEIPKILNMESLLLANGGILAKCLHPSPSEDMYEGILKFCPFIFNNIEDWKRLCYYLQIGLSRYPQTANINTFWAPKEIKNTKKEAIFCSEYILKTASELKLIDNLDICDDTVSFNFKNELCKKYFTDFGSWLELYCYIKLAQSKIFRDVKLSLKIGWVKQSFGFEGVVNEIDVSFFYKNIPCFLSCKIAEPTVYSLEELSMYSMYFGGKYSKVIMVTLSKVDKSTSKLFKRADSMGILLLDGEDLKSNKFLKIIEETLKI